MNQVHPTVEHLIDYLHGELPPHEDAAVHAHLAGCSTCSDTHDGEARLGELLREHACAEERELPPGLRERILAAAPLEQSQSWWQQLSSVLRPAIALPVAAAAALAVYFGVHTFHGRIVRGATIDATYFLENHAVLATTVPFGDSSVVPASLTLNDDAADEQAVDEAR